MHFSSLLKLCCIYSPRFTIYYSFGRHYYEQYERKRLSALGLFNKYKDTLVIRCGAPGAHHGVSNGHNLDETNAGQFHRFSLPPRVCNFGLRLPRGQSPYQHKYRRNAAAGHGVLANTAIITEGYMQPLRQDHSSGSQQPGRRDTV